MPNFRRLGDGLCLGAGENIDPGWGVKTSSPISEHFSLRFHQTNPPVNVPPLIRRNLQNTEWAGLSRSHVWCRCFSRIQMSLLELSVFQSVITHDAQFGISLSWPLLNTASSCCIANSQAIRF